LTTGAIFATFAPVVSETTLVLLLLLLLFVVAICCWFGAAGANVVQPADIFVLLLPLYGDDDCWRDPDGGDGEEECCAYTQTLLQSPKSNTLTITENTVKVKLV
jgi:hypothetical protein